ncbi:MAG: homoserine dehydrogenase [Desulfovibrionaceae bacterium]|nr:homoserine dehydrogenase [Desulfovibrionaceae bacterium]
MPAKPLRVALAGFGTVGGGLVRVLQENQELIRQRIGRDIEVRKVLVRDVHKPRAVALPEGAVLTSNPDELADDPDIDVLVELMGGIDAPHALITRALERGKHVVTANKALLAENGIGLFQMAAEKGLSLRYEASVAGAIPIVETLKKSLAGNRIESLVGILNGTSNYILSAMSSEGLDFDTALKQAQELGYAEADPTLDIDGHDAAHKLVLLIRLAYGQEYPYTAMPIRGIRGMNRMDIEFAREFGYRIKLIAQAHVEDGRLAARVCPTLVHHTYLLARVGGSFNAVRVEGNAVGSLFLHGRGAGDLPTASAVMGDLLAVARGERPDNTGFVAQTPERAAILPPEEVRSRYYVRVMVHDTPGVLRDIAAAMADEGISMAQVIQKTGEREGVPLVFMTHEASARAMRNALSRAVKAGLLTTPAVAYPVL